MGKGEYVIELTNHGIKMVGWNLSFSDRSSTYLDPDFNASVILYICLSKMQLLSSWFAIY